MSWRYSAPLNARQMAFVVIRCNSEVLQRPRLFVVRLALAQPVRPNRRSQHFRILHKPMGDSGDAVIATIKAWRPLSGLSTKKRTIFAQCVMTLLWASLLKVIVC